MHESWGKILYENFLANEHHYLRSRHNFLTSRHNYKSFFRQLWYVDFWDVMLTCQIMMSTCQIMTSTCHISIILLLSVWQKLGKNLFLAHLSWKLKAQVSFSDHLSSVVCPSVRPCVCKLFLFSTSSPEQQGQFQPNLAQSIIEWREYEGLHPFLRGNSNKIVEIH